MINSDSNLEKNYGHPLISLEPIWTRSRIQACCPRSSIPEIHSRYLDEIHTMLEKQKDDFSDPEDRDEYISRNIFWVHPETEWNYFQWKGISHRKTFIFNVACILANIVVL